MENVSGVLVRFKDQIFSYMNVPGVQIGLVDVVEILIISMLFYKSTYMDKNNKGMESV